MPGREHEAVAVGPVGIGRIELKELGKEHGCDVGHAHRHAGMARFRLLDRVHGQRPERIRHEAQPRVARARQGCGWDGG